MEDNTSLYLTIAFELGLPILLGLLALWPRARRWLVVVLGAVTPFLLFYAFNAFGAWRGDMGAALAFQGMWLTTLIPYAACAAFGAALGTALLFVRIKITKSSRFIAGVLPSAILALGWTLLWAQQ
ncbi:MAG: hypothetical protein QM776_15745 [Rhodocyclaceae bacterium]